MTQRIDVGAGVRSERHCVGGGGGAIVQHEIAVQFGQAACVRRVRRVVRHAGMPILSKIEASQGG